MKIFEQYITTRVVVERIEVVGPMERGEAVLKALWANNYRTLRSGPYTNQDMHPSVDMQRFLFIAEREVPALSA